MRNASKLLALVLGLFPAASAQGIHTHGIEEYPEIELNVETVVAITESGETVYFRFTPEVTAEYTFASAGADNMLGIDPEGYLYDSEMNQIAYHGDNGTLDFNFTLVHELEAGKTYVFGTNLYNVYTCLICGATTGELPFVNPFTDVTEGDWYYDSVMLAVKNGITTGATETTFDPEGKCLRASVVTFLWRAKGCPEPTTSVNPFTDVKESDFFYKAVLWAVEEGITNGITATTFAPYAECNRAQVVTFLYRTLAGNAGK